MHVADQHSLFSKEIMQAGRAVQITQTLPRQAWDLGSTPQPPLALPYRVSGAAEHLKLVGDTLA